MKSSIKRGLLLITIFLGILVPLAAQSTQLVVKMNNGSEKTFYMTEEDLMYFEDNTKLVIEQVVNTRSVKIPLADIRKITCNETEGTTENEETKPSLFPNPVHDVLLIKNLSGEQTMSIYAIDGRLMKSMEVRGDQDIDISDLPMGLYLVKTPSCTLKMIKL